MQERSYEVVVWGATGFTGRLVVEYLLNQYGTNSKLRWAIAGRNQTKLEEVCKQLEAPTLPLIIADSHDKASLEVMVRQTQVICSTVGPYALFGTQLVEACVENGTDYCDLTGEVQWIRKMIDTHHEQASEKQAKIVHCCGFDSIPSDFGVYFLQKEAQAKLGEYCQHIKMRVKGAKGGFSGGTYASLSNVLAEAEDNPKIYEILQNPYSLNPPGERSGPDQFDLSQAAFDEDLQRWISPFVMAAINTKIVRRSHALSGYPYGKDFQYEEATLHGKGFKSRSIANISAGIGGLLSLATPNSFIKKTADRFLPKPGEGPSKEVREAGYFNLLFLGKLADGYQLRAKVAGDKDPGYGSTSKMLAESAVCLALEKDNLPKQYGVLTPTTAMGDILLDRLSINAGLTFEIKE
ncbi:MAG: saccharopine dehydrogenase NADP-binding domain-containing protein [Bacteroidota bacterium]